MTTNNATSEEKKMAKRVIVEFAEVHIITPWDGAFLKKSAHAGDETAMAMLGAINIWLREVSDKQSHCIGCQALFDDDARPGAFAVAVALDKSGVAIRGICQQCLDGGDLRQIIESAPSLGH
jgi:hypothetical protein